MYLGCQLCIEAKQKYVENEIYTVIERLSNLLRAESRRIGNELGLQPVQFDALNYLAICNRYSDTPLAVTDYLGLTKGTVSQTLKVLESKGLIRKEKDPEDKRLVHLKLTEEGQAYIDKSTPPADFVAALDEQTKGARSVLLLQLRNVLSAYRESVGQSGFGVCRNCQHNLVVGGSFVCGLTKDILSHQDVELICREFS